MASQQNEPKPEGDTEKADQSLRFEILGRKSGKRTFLNHYQMELARIRTELRLSSYILKTTKKPITPYIPNVWNGLEPYVNTTDPEFVENLPNDVFVGGQSRLTALNLVDPEVDVRIDQSKVSLPYINLTRKQLLAMRKHEHERLAEDCPINPKSHPIPYSEKKGSTRLTPFGKVKYLRPEVARKKDIINFSDVRVLRRQMKDLFLERRKTKDKEDYVRTRQDFFRMDINVARERAHPENRYLLDISCQSYFGPSRGSLRALKQVIEYPKLPVSGMMEE